MYLIEEYRVKPIVMIAAAILIVWGLFRIESSLAKAITAALEARAEQLENTLKR